MDRVAVYTAIILTEGALPNPPTLDMFMEGDRKYWDDTRFRLHQLKRVIGQYAAEYPDAGIEWNDFLFWYNNKLAERGEKLGPYLASLMEAKV